MTNPDDDFAISGEAKEVFKLLGAQLTLIYTVHSELLCNAGLTKVQAIGAVAHMLIEDAAYISIKNRIENLDGEPSPERWRKATDAAWDSALESVQHKKEQEQTHDKP